jgi:hypothetical protein
MLLYLEKKNSILFCGVTNSLRHVNKTMTHFIWYLISFPNYMKSVLFNEVFDNRYLAVYNNSKSKESFKHNMLRVLLEEQPT